MTYLPFVAALIAATALSVNARGLSCAQDRDTEAVMCYPDAPMRASTDGKVREFDLYMGGPKGATKSGYTARVFCDNTYVPVMELRDRNGSVFARDQAGTRVGRDLAGSACGHSKTRTDKALDKVKRF